MQRLNWNQHVSPTTMHTITQEQKTLHYVLFLLHHQPEACNISTPLSLTLFRFRAFTLSLFYYSHMLIIFFLYRFYIRGTIHDSVAYISLFFVNLISRYVKKGRKLFQAHCKFFCCFFITINWHFTSQHTTLSCTRSSHLALYYDCLKNELNW